MAGQNKYVLIHCPSGQPGPPYAVVDIDRREIGRFPTLSEAQTFASEEAKKSGAKGVILSPFAQGHM
jgi:hypothetical protein